MKIEVKNEKDNPFMKRKELMVEISHEKEPTPSLAALQALLAKQLNAKQNNIEIIYTYSDKGKSSSKSRIFIWNEKDVGIIEGKKKG